jgi:hypothetical protein
MIYKGTERCICELFVKEGKVLVIRRCTSTTIPGNNNEIRQYWSGTSASWEIKVQL